MLPLVTGFAGCLCNVVPAFRPLPERVVIFRLLNAFSADAGFIEVQPAECPASRGSGHCGTSQDAQSNRHGWLARGEADCTEIRPARQKPPVVCNLRCAERC